MNKACARSWVLGGSAGCRGVQAGIAALGAAASSRLLSKHPAPPPSWHST